VRKIERRESSIQAEKVTNGQAGGKGRGNKGGWSGERRTHSSEEGINFNPSSWAKEESG